MNASDPKPDTDKQYDRAITLIQYHVQLFWLIFGAFLLAETVLLGAIASISKEGPDSFVFYGAILGLSLIFPWLATFCYNHALYTLRIHEARCLEPSVGEFFTNGKELIDKGASPLDPKIRIPLLARLLAPRRSVFFLIAVFAAAFLLVLITHRPSTWRDASSSANEAVTSKAGPKK